MSNAEKYARPLSPRDWQCVRHPRALVRCVWFGIGAPKNTPVEIVDKLNKEINAGLADSKMRARFADLGGTVLAGSPADFRKLMGEETESGAG